MDTMPERLIAWLLRSASRAELFAGFDRQATSDLVPYPTACAPQAWATGAIFAAAAVISSIAPDERYPHWRSLTIDGVDHGWSAA